VVERVNQLDARLLLATLYATLHLIETEGEESVSSWYRDEMDVEYAVRNYFKVDRAELPARAELLRCTLSMV
jgi:hypothetical protein